MSNINPPAITKQLNAEFNLEKELFVAPKNAALIIVDMQNDFLPGGSLEVDGGNHIIPTINALQPKFNLVVATQDWHPVDHKSFASQHTGMNVFEDIELNGLPQTLWPDHCVQGTEGADLSKDLDTHQIEAIFRKGMDQEIDSYSGFYDNGQRKKTGMAGYLKDRGIETIFICGLAADFCVYFTAIDGLDLGFEVIIIENACKPIAQAGYQIKKKNFMAKGGKAI